MPWRVNTGVTGFIRLSRAPRSHCWSQDYPPGIHPTTQIDELRVAPRRLLGIHGVMMTCKICCSSRYLFVETMIDAVQRKEMSGKVLT